MAGGTRLPASTAQRTSAPLHFVLQRASNLGGPWTQVGPIFEANADHYLDTTLRPRRTYYYRVVATNIVGYTTAFAPPAIGWPTATASSQPSSPSAAVVTP